MRHAYGLGEHYNSVERLKDAANAEDSWDSFTLGVTIYQCVFVCV